MDALLPSIADRSRNCQNSAHIIPTFTLKQGIPAWNTWRHQFPRIQPDLERVHLSGANLTGINLRGAILNFSYLNGADFAGTDLSFAKLHEADLSEAHLFGVILKQADLSGADLRGANLGTANLSFANLSEADLSEADSVNYTLLAGFAGITPAMADRLGADGLRAIAGDRPIDDFTKFVPIPVAQGRSYRMRTDLRQAKLTGANLWGAKLRRADLSGANLSTADLSGADLSGINLMRANLSGANLTGADLSYATLVETDFTDARLSYCRVYGISVWSAILYQTKQENLVITPSTEPTITVDNLKVAQFIYLLLNNAEIRDVIDTIAKKAVLILGRFPNERKMILEFLKDELRKDYSPIVFNFEEVDNRDFTAIVRTLANMARFVLIDLADLDDALREIADDIVPRCVVPIRPLLLQGSHQQEYELFRELGRKHRWVLAPYRYKDLPDLQSTFQEKVLQPINEKIIELKQKKPLKIFIGYAPEDKNMLKILKTHLRPLERAGLIELWDDQDVVPGEERRKEIERHLSDACIILLLISPAFLDSHDCYDIQMSVAVERHKQGKARVIPILLRPCAWQSTPLKELQPLPKDGKPISRHDKDGIFFEVSEEISDMVKILW